MGLSHEEIELYIKSQDIGHPLKIPSELENKIYYELLSQKIKYNTLPNETEKLSHDLVNS